MTQTVLGFDTSGGWCAAAVTRNGAVLAHHHMILPRGQGETLMPLLETVLREAGVEWRDLSAIGVGIGPGNFTGIRISVSAARGLALGLGIPSIGVNRFEAAALDGPDLPVVVPALRGHVWVQTPGQPPVQQDAAPAQAIGDGLTAPTHPISVAIALVAASRIGTDQPRPAPLYLREADAAPPSDLPPALIE